MRENKDVEKNLTDVNQESDFSEDNLLETVTVIPNDTTYWIIRSGIENTYFDDFYFDERIAIGWDRIDNLKKIKFGMKDSLKREIASKYPEIKDEKTGKQAIRKIGDISSKIYKFVHEVKIGDIIVTPGQEEILIGKIISEPYILSGNYKTVIDDNEGFIGELNKARNVDWIKKINRNEIEPNIRRIVGISHGIAHINDEQAIAEINRTLYGFFVTDNEAHSVYRVKSDEEIDFDKYAFFIKSLHDIYNMFNKDKSEKLLIKTNVQSPGPIEIYGNISLVSRVLLAAKAILKNDTGALNNLSNAEQIMTKNYIKNNPSEFEYDDYEFPNHNTY